ncbi:hypothetical protein ABMA27_007815 [Loxostege sticticalis]|uniref:DDE Tnp4 domain-containing protein n=1 Tax=Loxostege sticticalis TaxID=481309 RepID=A0ABR3HCZ4_LOXSC
MFKHFSIEDLSIIALLLEEEDKTKKRAKRIAVHPMLKKRKLEGEYWTLFKELVDDEKKIFIYFRMSRFLATGDSFVSIAFSYRLGVSTVHKIVKEVCSAIIERLMSETMPVPTKEQWQKIAEEFWNTWNFPNCIGAIDGKHVQITAPANSGSQFFNYKKTFSIVLMAIVDADYKFICVDVGAYGKNSDGESTNLPGTEITAPYVIIGDEAFPLTTYLMRPYPKPQLGDQRKKIFNDRLSRARKVVENAFGILSQKFRIYNRRIQLDPDNADNVIMATCILHNYIKSGGSQHSHNEEDIIASYSLSNLPRQGGNHQVAAFNVRENFARFFDSPEGALNY